jgi:serine phosphatase RsbU (regulator of sigma subunit)
MYSTGSNLAIDWRGDESSAPEMATPLPGPPLATRPGPWRASSIPPVCLPDGTIATPHVVVAHRSSSVQQHGGDLCVVYPIGEALLVVIGDATGHGYDAALVCALIRGACDVAAMALRPLTAPNLLQVLDRTLRTSGRGDIAMSCAVAIVASRTMTVASAGHPLPYVIRASGACEGVPCYGNLLGTGAPAPYASTTVALRPGDRVLWYTDGVLDTENEAGVRFGHRHLRNMLKSSHQLGASDLATELAAELFWFRGDAPAIDDASFAVAEIR